MKIGRFLGMVGGLIWCPTKQKYLILKRSSDKDFAGNVWECGTGRIDQGESFTQALMREVHEELGVEIQVDFIIGTAHFFRGERIPENEMIGVFYFCTLEDSDKIQVSWEHSTYRWVTPEEADELLPTGFWLVRLIKRAEYLRALFPAELIEYQREIGFEI
jgi:8-oxo-dGTP pyrophosphatase MutT (NUDIX family)